MTDPVVPPTAPVPVPQPPGDEAVHLVWRLREEASWSPSADILNEAADVLVEQGSALVVAHAAVSVLHEKAVNDEAREVIQSVLDLIPAAAPGVSQ
jgi:hypothetical protein